IDYIVNSSIRQTLTRSINTVLTVVIVVIALLVLGASSIFNFSLAFDRVREMLSKIKVITKEEQIDYIVNSSIRQTLTRSINTVLTVVIVVIALLVLGASSIFNFSL
ncbi:hypothetical protein DD865_15870, partial [Staphylococcus pseudintermedius]